MPQPISRAPGQPWCLFNSATISSLALAASEFKPIIPPYPSNRFTRLLAIPKAPLLLTLKNGETKSISGNVSDIIVDITWPANQAIADINDNYKQVPAPLPLLGAGAAFGMLRKMRQVSSLRKALPLEGASARST